jgi:hypothetical protein
MTVRISNCSGTFNKTAIEMASNAEASITTIGTYETARVLQNSYKLNNM